MACALCSWQLAPATGVLPIQEAEAAPWSNGARSAGCKRFTELKLDA